MCKKYVQFPAINFGTANIASDSLTKLLHIPSSAEGNVKLQQSTTHNAFSERTYTKPFSTQRAEVTFRSVSARSLLLNISS